MHIIKAENLRADLVEEKIEGITFSMDEGEILSVTGLENSGIYLLSKILAALKDDYEGSMEIFGKEVKKSREYLKETGVFLPNSHFYDELTGFDMIKYSLFQRGLKEDRERIDFLRKILGLNDEILKKKAVKYSTYEARSLDLLITHMVKNRLTILFDPSSQLRDKEKAAYHRFLTKEREEGRSLIVLTPYSGLAEEFSDKVIYLEKGTMVTREEYGEERKKDREIIRRKLTEGILG